MLNYTDEHDIIQALNLNIHQKIMQTQVKKLSLCSKLYSKFSSYMRLKFISVILLMAFAVTCNLNAQKITLESGYFNPKRVGTTTSETYFDAIRLGALVEFDWKYNFGIQTGLHYNIGYSNKIQKYGVTTDSVVYNTWNHALEIPLRIVYHQPLFKKVSIFGFAGPNIQIGLIQNQSVDSYLSENLTNITGIQPGKFDLYQSDIQRINLQLGAGGGVQWRQFILKSGYDWGLNNLDRSKSDRVKQGQWYVTFGYQIK
jgi:hypothetical protein